MLQRTLWCAFAGFGALCHAIQVPLALNVDPPPGASSIGEAAEQARSSSVEDPHYAADSLSAEDQHDPLADWQLDSPPSVNSTAHLVFETVSSLLQHWPNTRMRNGHNIVPGTVPTGTLLYHGTWHSELPAGPDWTALDPEHSVLFCESITDDGGCWHLTLMTTRPLNVVYFDGTSSAKLLSGTLDSQDIVALGDVRPDWSIDELDRLTALCNWGRENNVDGFVRMEMSFEIMLCNFTSGVRVVSFSNIVDPVMPRSTSSKFSPTFEVIYAGSWHNRYPGETRIQLDLSGLVSFYDMELVPSLVPARFGKERWDHRLLNISTEDVVRVRARLVEILSRPASRPTGIDWPTLIRVVVDRYSERLELVRYLLDFTGTDRHDSDNVIDYAIKTQVQLRHMLMPYILVDVIPRSINAETKQGGSDVLDWARLVYKLCATTHTGMFKDDAMTSSEKLLLNAVRGTTREICRVVTKMWGSGVLAGVDQFMGTDGEPDVETIQNLVKTWREDIDELMAWLDWNVWVKCRPACGPEEMCYLTTWPVGFPLPSNRTWIPRPDPAPMPTTTTPVPWRGKLAYGKPEKDWQRPQPRCIRRVDPYDLGVRSVASNFETAYLYSAASGHTH
ncbi:hypothetical protein EDC04DRAFT_2571742 [Pisolithus marmoratus]|nr:hypothetical protein EDC04DRAFT_2571742 [Pisolithus marmoratus]